MSQNTSSTVWMHSTVYAPRVLHFNAFRGVSVCVLCVSVISHLTYAASVRPENTVTYSAGNEGKKVS